MTGRQSPESRPVVIFDGDCSLCTGMVERLKRWDSHHRLSYISYQSEAAETLLASCSTKPDPTQSLVLVYAGRCRTQSTAVLHTLAHLGWPWRLLSLLLICPRPLRDALYSFVAHRRHHWPRR